MLPLKALPHHLPRSDIVADNVYIVNIGDTVDIEFYIDYIIDYYIVYIEARPRPPLHPSQPELRNT